MKFCSPPCRTSMSRYRVYLYNLTNLFSVVGKVGLMCCFTLSLYKECPCVYVSDEWSCVTTLSTPKGCHNSIHRSYNIQTNDHVALYIISVYINIYTKMLASSLHVKPFYNCELRSCLVESVKGNCLNVDFVSVMYDTFLCW